MRKRAGKLCIHRKEKNLSPWSLVEASQQQRRKNSSTIDICRAGGHPA